jgi:HlyD family secretion protein
MWGRIVSAAVVLLIVAATGWALWPRPTPIEVESIDRRDLQVTVEEEGTTRIREVFRVSAPIGGSLTRLDIHAGDVVAEGDAIASIRPVGPGLLDDRSRRIAEATAEVAAAAVELAEVNLTQAQAQREFAATERDRTQSLAARGLVSTRINEQAMLAAATAESSVRAARAALLMRRQELQSAQAALIEGDSGADADVCCVAVRAPADGQVLTVFTESEQVVQPGTPLLDIGDPAEVEIVVDVLSSDAVRIVEGAAARIEGWGGEPLSAQVTRIEPVATTRTSALGIEEQRTKVTLAFTDAADKRERLGHGFHVIARIVVWEAQDTLTVPMASLFRRGENWAAFVVEDDTARVRIVTLGQRNADYAQVASGLAAGEVVIIHPGDLIAEGVRVSVPAEGD